MKGRRPSVHFILVTTPPPSSAPSGPPRPAGPIDATLIAGSPAELLGRQGAEIGRTFAAGPASSSGAPTWSARGPAPELLDTLDRPLASERSHAPELALERTRVSHPSAQVASLDPAPGKLGRFNVLRTLGEGGMGVVYAAYDEELDRKIAIKVLRDSSQGSDARARMLREAQAMARLSHPNVVQVHDVGEHAGQIYVAMEFVKGTTLRAWLEEQPRTWQQIRDMFVQAGRGLAAAHAEGIVHRDFKPDNVLVGTDGRARVADFGLAGAGGPPPGASGEAPVPSLGRGSAFSTSLTMAGTIMGTPAYMSPEQHNGAATDARSDQFSFCVALWGAVYGQQPFAGESVIDLAEAVTTGALVEPTSRGQVPDWLHAALLRGLATEPAARFATIDALLAAITVDLAAPRVAGRWRWITAALVAAALTAGGFTLATRERDPTIEELAAISALAGAAREAGAAAHWVYPPRHDPRDTSILRVVALERIDGPAERPARAESTALRREFADALAGLGDRYWDAAGGRPFARDYYSQALVFQPDHPRARERGLYTPGQLAELQGKAERGEFSAADVAAAELLEILADDQPERRDTRLRAFIAEHGTANQRELLAGLLGPAAVGLPAPKDSSLPKLEPEFPGEPAPAPEPPVVAAAEPAPTPTRPRTPKAEPKPTTAPPASEPEEQLAQATQDRARSDALTAEAEAARRGGDFDAAERLFNQALAAYSRNGAALMGLSDLEFDRGHFEQAVVHAERAVKAEPKKSDFRIRLGDAYFKVLRYPDAKTQYEKAAELGHPRAVGRLDKVKEKIGG